MDDLHNPDLDGQPEARDNRKGPRPRLQVAKTLPAGVVRPLERLARIETCLEALAHVLESVAEGQAVLHDTIRQALSRVRRDLGQAPPDEDGRTCASLGTTTARLAPTALPMQHHFLARHRRGGRGLDQ